VELAVNTGVAPREWLRDPAAMATAIVVLEKIGAELEKTRR
jgi:hypothetical protein